LKVIHLLATKQDARHAEEIVTLQQKGNGSSTDSVPSKPVSVGEREILHEEAFKRLISVERKRTERSSKPFLLMLLETGGHYTSEKNGHVLANILSALLAATRETDVIGWYKNKATAGVMFTELEIDDKNSILSTMLTRVSNILQGTLTFEQFNKVSISFHFFPDTWDHEVPQRPSDPTLYPDLSRRENATRLISMTKRMIDIIGSLLIIVICAPALLMIALAIKVSSKGPVLFRQRRVGKYGKSFTFLKFRSMQVNNDASIHKEYVAQLIAGHAKRNLPNGSNGNGDGAGVYKITNDARITPLGRFLRRSSLDELPQLLNVLKGEMSLVGPRPAIPYELAAYQIWHRRRVLEVKPGITGLWQVNGRSRIKFDEMVRLDLKYAETWSPWLDIKILLRTPRAVLVGEGAY
jgi:exopolysaccharide biosynthesis polyprenyl glycosylphosphotransferase